MVLVSIVINYFISKHLINTQSKKDHQHQKHLAFMAPAFQKKMLDTKDFIEEISTKKNLFIQEFYEIPESYMIELVKFYYEPNLDRLIINSLVGFKDGEACHRYEGLRYKKNNPWESLYLALSPDLLSHIIKWADLFGDYHEKHRLFIPENIQATSNILILEILKTTTTLKEDILTMFEFDNEDPHILFKRFQKYWIDKNNRWNGYIEEMNTSFLQLWDSGPVIS